MLQTLPDQQTSHESVPDEAHVGRFSSGIETVPRAPATLHRGRFSEGLEQLPETPRKRHPGRFSDGLDQLAETAAKTRRGSFADGQEGLPAAKTTRAGDRAAPRPRPSRRGRATLRRR
jgi:hypothetical protein